MAVPAAIGLGFGCGGGKGNTSSGFGGTASNTTGTSSQMTGTTGPGTGGNIFNTTSNTGTGSGMGGSGGNTNIVCDPGQPTMGPPQWALRNSQPAGTQNVLGLATDVQGNVLVAGAYGINSAVTLDPLPPTMTNPNSNAALVAELSPTGTPLWANGYPADIEMPNDTHNGTLYSTARAVAADSQGRVWVGGDFLGYLHMGPLVIESAGTQHFFGDAFVAQFDSSGNPKQLLRFGDDAATTPSNGGGAQSITAIATHKGATGDMVAIAGKFETQLDLTALPNGTMLNAVTSGDNAVPAAFVVVMRAADNSVVFETQLGDGSFEQAALGVAFDGSGDVLVTGYSKGALSFPGGTMLTPTGAQAAFVAKIKGDGSTTAWAKVYGDMSASGAGVASDANGDVFVAGQHTGTIDLGGGPIMAVGGSNAFVIKLSTSGSYVWGHSFGDGAAQEATGIAVDAKGHAIVTGAFEGKVNFGASQLVSQGQDDVFLAKLDTHGCQFWAKSFGDMTEQSGNAVVVDAMGNAIVAGNMFGTVNFGGTPLTAPSGAENLFVAKFGP
jgi:hypothetical protein